jgi:hypothetical protein
MKERKTLFKIKQNDTGMIEDKSDLKISNKKSIEGKLNLKIFAKTVIIIFIIAYTLLITIPVFKKYYDYLTKFKQTEATVLSIKKTIIKTKKDSKGYRRTEKKYVIEVEFSVDGQKIKKEIIYNRYPKVGEKIEIRYNPQNPYKFKAKSTFSIIFVISFIIFYWILLAIIAIIIFRQGKQEINNKTNLKEGRMKERKTLFKIKQNDTSMIEDKSDLKISSKRSIKDKPTLTISAKRPVILFIVYTFIVFTLLKTFPLFKENYEYLTKFKQTEATVLSIKETATITYIDEGYRRTEKEYVIEVEFSVDGQKIKKEIIYSRYLKVGEKIEIKYNPQNPYEFTTIPTIGSQLIILGILFIWLLLAAIAISI